MKNIFYRFTHNREGEQLNPLLHIFFFITLVNGIAFTFFTQTNTVSETVLYQHTKDAFGTLPLPIWGVCAMMVVAVNTGAIFFRKRKYLGLGGMLGFGVWCFAFFIYLQDALWFQLLAGAVPNMAFWVWYYVRVKWYYNK